MKRIYSDKPKYLNQVGKEVYIMKKKWKMVRVDEETHHKLLLAKLKTDKAITRITREAITEYLSKLGIFMLLLFFLPFASALDENVIPDGYRYYLPLTVINQGGELNSYQLSFLLDTLSLVMNGRIRSDCGDLRVIDENGNLIPLWVEECPSTESRLWIKVDLPATSTKELYLIYGNPNSTMIWDGEDVFDFFDDFDAGFSSLKWEKTGGSVPVISHSILTVRGQYESIPEFNYPVIVESRHKYPCSGEDADTGLSIFGDTYKWASGWAFGSYTSGYLAVRRMPLVWDSTTTHEKLNLGMPDSLRCRFGLVSFTFIPEERITTAVVEDGVAGDFTTNIPEKIRVGFSTTHYFGNGDETWTDWIRVRKYSESTPIVEKGMEVEIEEEEQEENQNNQGAIEGTTEGSDNLPIILWFAVAIGVAFFPIEFPLKAVIYIMMVMLGFGLGIHEQYNIIVAFPFALMFYDGAKWYFGRGK